jgi:hypothetical protein
MKAPKVGIAFAPEDTPRRCDGSSAGAKNYSLSRYSPALNNVTIEPTNPRGVGISAVALFLN